MRETGVQFPAKQICFAFAALICVTTTCVILPREEKRPPNQTNYTYNTRGIAASSNSHWQLWAPKADPMVAGEV